MAIERADPNHVSWSTLSAPHLSRYLFAAGMAVNKSILDAGTGTGYGAKILANAGAKQVLGIDIDPDTIRKNTENNTAANISFRVEDCEQMSDTDGPFDLICNFENIEHLANPQAFLAGVKRRLAPGGALLISTPDRLAGHGEPASNPVPQTDSSPEKPSNPYHVQEWTRPEFHDLLCPFFHDVQMLSQVQTRALSDRQAAVEALQDALKWTNPVAMFLWRKFVYTKFHGRKYRSWKALEFLASPSIGDYPIVPVELGNLYGSVCYHVAICKNPK